MPNQPEQLSPVILTAPVILAAAGIQSPCCHPHVGRLEVLPRFPPRVIVALTVLAHCRCPGTQLRRG